MHIATPSIVRFDHFLLRNWSHPRCTRSQSDRPHWHSAVSYEGHNIYLDKFGSSKSVARDTPRTYQSATCDRKYNYMLIDVSIEGLIVNLNTHLVFSHKANRASAEVQFHPGGLNGLVRYKSTEADSVTICYWIYRFSD